MELIDNRNKTLKDDLASELNSGSKLSIAAACFSIYAFQELKNELKNIDELRFIFTAPSFTTENTPKEKREFYIPRMTRERNLYGTEFEVKLRNELTQKAIAKECAEWIRQKVRFKSNITNDNMMGFINLDDKNYMPINGFTTVDLGCERGNYAYSFIQKTDMPFSKTYIDLFDELWNDKNRLQDVTDIVLDNINVVYKENAPEFIYFLALYNIFNEFLEDISEDVLPNEATGFKQSKIWNMLYNFQRDAVLAIINKLEQYNGCILADSVGLGKTFTALAVIKYYESKNRNVLVLCPKKLSENWNTYKDNYKNNPIASDRLRYDVLFHTDLSREHGSSNGLDLDRLNWENYDLVVIDESHNFRNGGEVSGQYGEKENRYLKLLNKVIRPGVKTKVLMLSATPVNNKFNDLKNQLALAYEGNTELINSKLNTRRSIDDIFRLAQRAFNSWSELPVEKRTTENLLRTLDFDFFEVLDSVTIARSRKHIEKFYNTEEIGTFPERLKPISLRPDLTDLSTAINYNEIYEQLISLNLLIYAPTSFVFESQLYKYTDVTEKSLTRTGRESGIRRLMSIQLLKRLESSVYSFSLTLKRIKELIDKTIKEIEDFKSHGKSIISGFEINAADDFDFEDQNIDDHAVGKKVKIDLADMDYKSWERELRKDSEILELLLLMIADITPEHDSKLQKLFDVISDKIENPINENNKKILIFTAFSDTANYLYENVSTFIKSKYGLNTAEITGTIDGKTTIPRFSATLNNVLTCFSPISKDKQVLMPNNDDSIDILIATDCISEGQNLQDCDYCINYDIHWNPVRIIQRFGRIDRIGSKNTYIQLVNFWPNVTLDDYINLKNRVETRMKITVMTSTGDDDLINAEEKGDLEYRKAQLKRLQEEVVDIEDMSSGISIMDLGLNEFRLDLLAYSKNHGKLDSVPFGMNAIVPANEEMPAGVIFVLKNRTNAVNIGQQNRLHPFYMVYVAEDGSIICDHLSPKELLDKMRYLCKEKTTPYTDLCAAFNKETRDGRDMKVCSKLLEDAIHSIVNVKEESDIDSFLGGSQMSFLANEIKGLDDFELICFLVVKDNNVTTTTPALKKPFRLVVAGTRYYNNYTFVASKLDAYLADKRDKYDITIICGDAQGADAMGFAYASNHNLKIEHFPAEWGRFGSAAGPIRNKKMAQKADAVIVFWDGKSPGTRDMIQNAKAEGLPCTVINI